MASKKITILVVPDGTHRIRRFNFPRFLPFLFAFLFICCSAFAFWGIRDYLFLKGNSPKAAQLKKENELQKNQIKHLAKRVDQITEKLVRLKEFDRKLKIMVNLKTLDDKGGFEGIGGSDLTLFDPAQIVAMTDEELIRQMHNSLDNLDTELAVDQKSKEELFKFLESQKILLASTPSTWPTRGWLSSGFGYRISPFTGKKEFHRGIDIATRMSAPILAPANGIVSSVGTDHGYGNVLSIRHGYGLVTKYAHIKKALVKKGQHVKRGETVALVGSSGRSTGPHLHYEVHLNRVAVDPRRYILE